MARISKSNPNGANQYLLDPRQKICWDLYINPKSETFGNALQSALKAGYTDGSSRMITTEEWFLDRLRRMNLLRKAEKVLDKTLDGKDLRLAQDTAKFIAKTQGKNEGYTERTEHLVATHEVSKEELEEANNALLASE